MQALLVQQGLWKTLEGMAKLWIACPDGDKEELLAKAHYTIVLFLENKVLREVKEKIMA